MSDEPQSAGVWQRLKWTWIALAVLILYPASFYPVCLIGAWLIAWGVIPEAPANRVAMTVYTPLVWIADRSPIVHRTLKIVGDAVEPLAPRR